MDCLDANVVQDLMGGSLDETSRAAAVAHLDGCEECRTMLSTLARTVVGDQRGLEATVGALEATAAAGETTIAPSSARTIRPQEKGKRLGRYTVQDQLGAGAMGVVYRADDAELGRSVALKLLHRPDDELTSRLVREARAMAQVNHPHVVAVYDVGEADGAFYIAMELVVGRSLRGWQAEHAPREIIEAYVAAGRGLAAAHAAGIVHRDFKPDNVLVGDDGRVRVTDFGLAGDAEPEGLVLGTPAYMAPEQFVGGNVDARTDQFNFCVALYEALYKERPFTGKTFEELGDNVQAGAIKPAPAGSKVSQTLRAIILRGLSVKPGDRYATMDFLLAELGRDRAKPWRITAGIAAAVTALLALAVGADFVLRDRLLAQIHESFALTETQVDRAVTLLTNQFDINANQVYTLPVMREVAAHHDQADFGLGDEASDAADLDKIQEELVSQDWVFVRRFGATQYQSTIAVADYKSRLLFTSANAEAKRTDLSHAPWIATAGRSVDSSSIVLMRADDPALAPIAPPAAGLVFLFTRTLLLNKVSTSQFMQMLDAATLLGDARLDQDTKLSLVAKDGTAIGDAIPTGDVVTSTIPVRAGGTEIAHVVMARELSGVIAVFPHARLVFMLAMFGALAVCIGAQVRGRQIAVI